jgi:hypothetical protein
MTTIHGALDMNHLRSLVHADAVLTGPVRPRSIRDRAHVAATLRTRRAIREAARAAAERDA